MTRFEEEIIMLEDKWRVIFLPETDTVGYVSGL